MRPTPSVEPVTNAVFPFGFAMTASSLCAAAWTASQF
jgi:hypothetical protein